MAKIDYFEPLCLEFLREKFLEGNYLRTGNQNPREWGQNSPKNFSRIGFNFVETKHQKERGYV